LKSEVRVHHVLVENHTSSCGRACPPATHRRRRWALTLGALLVLVGGAVLFGTTASTSGATAGPLTVQWITWSVVGLDSNNHNSGPDTFPRGFRICNTGSDAVSGVSETWYWGTGSPGVTADGAFNAPANNTALTSIGTLAGGACSDVFTDVVVKRSGGNTVRTHNQDATVVASSTTVGVATASATKHVYIESLVSQNRNKTKYLSGPGGCNITFTVCDPPKTNIYVGQTYTYKLYAQTSTAYDEIEAFTAWPSFVQVTSGSATFSNVTPPASSAGISWWNDACVWNDLGGGSGTCTGSGKAGGKVVTTYTVKATTPGTSGGLGATIYDKSGSSFHYNSDYSGTSLTSAFNAKWKLTGSVVGNGTVTSSPAGTTESGTSTGLNCGTSTTICDVGYGDGTSVTITATPGAGQTFTGWSGGSCSGTTNPCVVTMNQARSVTATFTGTTSYPLTVTTYGSGTVTSAQARSAAARARPARRTSPTALP